MCDNEIMPFNSNEIEKIKMDLSNDCAFNYGISNTILRLIATIDILKEQIKQNNIIKESNYENSSN